MFVSVAAFRSQHIQFRFWTPTLPGSTPLLCLTIGSNRRGALWPGGNGRKITEAPASVTAQTCANGK